MSSLRKFVLTNRVFTSRRRNQNRLEDAIKDLLTPLVGEDRCSVGDAIIFVGYALPGEKEVKTGR